jgi:ribosomal protein S14
MKKLIEKDKKLRISIKKTENEYFILKSILKNCNFLMLTRWKAFIKLKSFSSKLSKVSVSDRCVHSFNKKRFNKFTSFSRHIYLKLIRSGKIPGMQKSSW